MLLHAEFRKWKRFTLRKNYTNLNLCANTSSFVIDNSEYL